MDYAFCDHHSPLTLVLSIDEMSHFMFYLETEMICLNLSILVSGVYYQFA